MQNFEANDLMIRSRAERRLLPKLKKMEKIPKMELKPKSMGLLPLQPMVNPEKRAPTKVITSLNSTIKIQHSKEMRSSLVMRVLSYKPGHVQWSVVVTNLLEANCQKKYFSDSFSYLSFFTSDSDACAYSHVLK